MVMLDTNICIYILKERPAYLLEKFIAAESLHISSIVYAELWSGIEKSGAKSRPARQGQLQYFLSLLKIKVWDEAAALAYAKHHTVLQKRGCMIGNMDLLIAAHAVSLNATLVTNNEREFSRVTGLSLENWVNP